MPEAGLYVVASGFQEEIAELRRLKQKNHTDCIPRTHLVCAGGLRHRGEYANDCLLDCNTGAFKVPGEAPGKCLPFHR
jgi:hypothetical protein